MECTDQISGRCYCGAVSLTATEKPLTSVYCHCVDCRRWTGAVTPAFAAFDEDTVSLSLDLPERSHAEGVWRRICAECGSPLTARFSYLPGQIYIPLGILDQSYALSPREHCHTQSALPWVEIKTDMPQSAGSARARLKKAAHE